ncbi:MAG: phage regulatory CII family protein [Verrucomicrobiota bacterium]
MKSHELCRKLLEQTNAKELAETTGLSISMIYKWAQPSSAGGSGTLNPLDRVEQLLNLPGGRSVVEWVCEKAGGYFVENPKETPEDKRYGLMASTNKTVQDFGEMLAAIATAALDNSITDQEAQDIRAIWQHLKSTTEEFVRCCEEGRFEAIRNR